MVTASLKSEKRSAADPKLMTAIKQLTNLPRRHVNCMNEPPTKGRYDLLYRTAFGGVADG